MKSAKFHSKRSIFHFWPKNRISGRLGRFYSQDT